MKKTTMSIGKIDTRFIIVVWTFDKKLLEQTINDLCDTLRAQCIVDMNGRDVTDE